MRHGKTEREKTQKRSNLNFERVTIKDIERDVIRKMRIEDDKRESDDIGHTTGCLGSRLEKKQTINSRKRHALCDRVLS